jgi:hypothetical protein
MSTCGLTQVARKALATSEVAVAPYRPPPEFLRYPLFCFFFGIVCGCVLFAVRKTPAFKVVLYTLGFMDGVIFSLVGANVVYDIVGIHVGYQCCKGLVSLTQRGCSAARWVFATTAHRVCDAYYWLHDRVSVAWRPVTSVLSCVADVHEQQCGAAPARCSVPQASVPVVLHPTKFYEPVREQSVSPPVVVYEGAAFSPASVELSSQDPVISVQNSPVYVTTRRPAKRPPTVSAESVQQLMDECATPKTRPIPARPKYSSSSSAKSAVSMTYTPPPSEYRFGRP